MFSGQKFQEIHKADINRLSKFEQPSNLTRWITHIDNWALTYGYEYHSMNYSCVIFKRVGG